MFLILYRNFARLACRIGRHNNVLRLHVFYAVLSFKRFQRRIDFAAVFRHKIRIVVIAFQLRKLHRFSRAFRYVRRDCFSVARYGKAAVIHVLHLIFFVGNDLRDCRDVQSEQIRLILHGNPHVQSVIFDTYAHQRVRIARYREILFLQIEQPAARIQKPFLYIRILIRKRNQPVFFVYRGGIIIDFKRVVRFVVFYCYRKIFISEFIVNNRQIPFFFRFVIYVFITEGLPQNFIARVYYLPRFAVVRSLFRYDIEFC